MPTGDPTNTCPFCGQTYYVVHGHSCPLAPIRPWGWPGNYVPPPPLYVWQRFCEGPKISWSYSPIAENDPIYIIQTEKGPNGCKLELLHGKQSLAKIECTEFGYGHCLEALKKIAVGEMPQLELNPHGS